MATISQPMKWEQIRSGWVTNNTSFFDRLDMTNKTYEARLIEYVKDVITQHFSERIIARSLVIPDSLVDAVDKYNWVIQGFNAGNAKCEQLIVPWLQYNKLLDDYVNLSLGNLTEQVNEITPNNVQEPFIGENVQRSINTRVTSKSSVGVLALTRALQDLSLNMQNIIRDAYQYAFVWYSEPDGGVYV